MEILFRCITELGFHRDFVHVEVFLCCIILYPEQPELKNEANPNH